MKWAHKTRKLAKPMGTLVAAILVCVTTVFATEPTVQSSVDIYWKSTRAIVAPGVSTVVVLDDQIAHAELGNDTIEFAGLSRGDTVALAYVNGAPVSIVVHVIERPTVAISPSLLRREAELAHGVMGSDFQTTSGNNSHILALDTFSWSQRVGDHATDFNTLVEDNSQLGGHRTNLRRGGFSYRTPHLAINVLDFSQTLSGSLPEDRINNFSAPNIMELRGVGVTLDHGKNEYSVFAGTSVPYYFLSLNATREVAGFSFHRKQTENLSLFGSTEYVNLPLSLPSGTQRHSYIMGNAGMSYRIGKSLLIGAQGGISNAGGMVRGDVSYTSYRFSGFASAITTSQTFPINQLQSLFAGNSDFKAEASYRLTSRLTQRVYVEHTKISPGLIYTSAGSSDYISPSFSFALSSSQTLGVGYIYSRSSGGFTNGQTTGRRYDISLSSRLTQRLANTAQVTVGSVQDPLQINSQDQFTIRDTVSIPIKGQTLLLGVEQDRTNPSLLAKLNQEITLLSPALQAQFQSNPTAFIDSSNFPPEVKALLAAEQPTGTTVSASTNLSIGSKLRMSPNVSVTHSANGPFANSWTQSFGYSLSYQFRPSLQLRSSVNNVLLWDAHQNTTQRTTLLSFGFQKMFSTSPGTLPWSHRSRIIEGRVFRDNNINGAFNVGEPGLAAVEVRLEDGQVAITDEQGRYKFPSVSADQHQVSIALIQFRHPVRMTTRSEAEADLIQQRIAVLNFGILDFARIMGNVFNDLRFDNRRQPDSKGMQGIELLLENGKEVRKIQTSGSGDFEVDDVPPGDYKLSLDASSVPANYTASNEAIAIHISPVTTMVQDIPMRALRSISGRVLLKLNSDDEKNSARRAPLKTRREKLGGGEEETQQSAVRPVAGVQIIAGPSSAVTDKEGNFLLRNLPAGTLKVTIQPVRAVPDGIKVPSGEVKLPAEPIQIQGATIVITNAELLPYLTKMNPQDPTGLEQRFASVGNAQREAKVPQPTAVRPVAAVTKQNGDSAKQERGDVSATATLVSIQTHSATSFAAVPSVMPVPPAVSTSSNPGASSEGSRKSVPTNLTRQICETMRSLGEAAQCFRQLKQLSSAGGLQ